jgi:CRISPR-associated protein Cas8b/Csh1 subtype I-B
LLSSLYKIGQLQKDGSEFADDPKVKLVIGIAFVKKNNRIIFDSVKISEYQEKSLYLYKRDTSGKPGLFLSGTVNQSDIKNIIDTQDKSSKDEIIQDFIKKKIMWFPKGKLINNEILAEFQDVQADLEQIFSVLEANKTKIGKEIISLVQESKPQKYLITLMPPNNGESVFVGTLDNYVAIFNKGALNKKTSNNQKLICSVCNQSKIIEAYIETPLPFYFTDKITFFPNLDDSQRNKGFPLCDKCNSEIQKGWKYIKKSWDFSITSLGGKSGDIRFWLIPHLQDINLLKKLEKDRQNSLFYINELKELFSTVKQITEFETGSSDVNSFLRFSSLFYSMDSHFHMRITDYVQGILPEQLQKLLIVKKIVDEKYPYPQMSQKIKKLDLSFGFPLLVSLFSKSTPQWQEQLIEILENIFTGREVNKSMILRIINEKIYKLWKEQNPNVFFECIKFLLVLEYLIRLENNQLTVEPLSQTALTPQIAQLEKFLSEHSEILHDNNSISTFGTGVAVGILLEVQSERYQKVAPFWSRLNKLDLDLDRIKEYFPQVKSYLAMYGEQDFDTIINYIGANLVSKMDPSKQIHKEQLNFVFSLGMSVGYLIKRNYLK